MIKPEEVAKLAELARLEMFKDEQEAIGRDLSAILDYVSELKMVSVDFASTGPDLELTAPGNSKSNPMLASLPTNVWREDAVSNESGADTEKLLTAAPATQDGYFKVKKILG